MATTKFRFIRSLLSFSTMATEDILTDPPDPSMAFRNIDPNNVKVVFAQYNTISKDVSDMYTIPALFHQYNKLPQAIIGDDTTPPGYQIENVPSGVLRAYGRGSVDGIYQLRAHYFAARVADVTHFRPADFLLDWLRYFALITGTTSYSKDTTASPERSLPSTISPQRQRTTEKLSLLLKEISLTTSSLRELCLLTTDDLYTCECSCHKPSLRRTIPPESRSVKHSPTMLLPTTTDPYLNTTQSPKRQKPAFLGKNVPPNSGALSPSQIMIEELAHSGGYTTTSDSESTLTSSTNNSRQHIFRTVPMQTPLKPQKSYSEPHRSHQTRTGSNIRPP